MLYNKTFHNVVPSPVTIEGTTMTVPGLADDLVTLLESAVYGDKLPDNGLGNNFDENDEYGLERISRPSTINELFDMPELNVDEVEPSVAQNEETIISDKKDSSEESAG